MARMPVESTPSPSTPWSTRRSTASPTSWPGWCATWWCWSRRSRRADDPDLLGLYDGVALTERCGDYGDGAARPDLHLPQPAARDVETAEELVEEVRITVVHEIAHHFGIDDARLHELGYA